MVELCLSESIPEGKCKGFHLDAGDVFIVRRDGILYAYANECPHLGTPLNWQEDTFLDSDSELIQCATHGALFIIETGHCVSGPCARANLKAREIKEIGGSVFLVN